MIWVVIIIAAMIVATCMESKSGKVIVGTGVVAIGMLILSWITGANFFIFLAKACAVLIVIIIIGLILLAIIGSGE